MSDVAEHVARAQRPLKRGEYRTGCPFCPLPDCYLYATSKAELTRVISAHRAEFHPEEVGPING